MEDQVGALGLVLNALVLNTLARYSFQLPGLLGGLCRRRGVGAGATALGLARARRARVNPVGWESCCGW
ncbi:hypothetical protein ACIA8H_35745 [Streptomyces goshikiensis]|uniref:hypothetical protein n=1 Tax=Streptomyces goshikiensis TaxID=1942 RepID=UPI0037948401